MTDVVPVPMVQQVPPAVSGTSGAIPPPPAVPPAPPVAPTGPQPTTIAVPAAPQAPQPPTIIEGLNQIVPDKKQVYTATYTDLKQLDKALESLAQNLSTSEADAKKNTTACFYETTATGTAMPPTAPTAPAPSKAIAGSIWNLNESFACGISVRQQIISLLVARQSLQFNGKQHRENIWDQVFDMNAFCAWIPFPSRHVNRFHELSLDIMKNEEQFASVFNQTKKFLSDNTKDKTRPDVVFYGQQTVQFLEQIVNLRVNTIQMVEMFQQDQCLYDAFIIRSVTELLRFVQSQWDHDRSKQTKEKHATVTIMQKQLLQIPEMMQSQEKWRNLITMWGQLSEQYQRFRAELLYTVKTLDVELYNWLWIRSQIHPDFPVTMSQSMNEIRYPLQMLIAEHQQLIDKLSKKEKPQIFTQGLIDQINNWKIKLDELSKQIKEADELSQKAKFLNNLLQLATQDQYAFENNQLAVRAAQSMQQSIKGLLEKYGLDYIRMFNLQNDKLKKTREVSEIFNCHFNSNQEKLKQFSEFVYEQNAKCLELEKKLLDLHSEALTIRLMNQLMQHIQTYKEHLSF
jgi:hypothetical protein